MKSNNNLPYTKRQQFKLYVLRKLYSLMKSAEVGQRFCVRQNALNIYRVLKEIEKEYELGFCFEYEKRLVRRKHEEYWIVILTKMRDFPEHLPFDYKRISAIQKRFRKIGHVYKKYQIPNVFERMRNKDIVMGEGF